jgi:hypothetical protein
MVHIGIGEIVWSQGQTDIYTALCGNTQPIKTHSHYSSIEDQLPDGVGGYSSGGKVMEPMNISIVSNVAVFDSANVSWIDATITAYFAIVYHNYGTPALISFHDFGGIKSVVSGRITVEWAYDGVFHLTIAPAS